MKKYVLSLIIENSNKRKVELIGSEIKDLIQADQLEIEKYYKFPNSYRLWYSGEIGEDLDLISSAVKLTGRICSPWIISLKNEEREVELIFNKTEFSRYGKINFNSITWGNFDGEYQPELE